MAVSGADRTWEGELLREGVLVVLVLVVVVLVVVVLVVLVLVRVAWEVVDLPYNSVASSTARAATRAASSSFRL